MQALRRCHTAHVVHVVALTRVDFVCSVPEHLITHAWARPLDSGYNVGCVGFAVLQREQKGA